VFDLMKLGQEPVTLAGEQPSARRSSRLIAIAPRSSSAEAAVAFFAMIDLPIVAADFPMHTGTIKPD
jgi:hypothetical protein